MRNASLFVIALFAVTLGFSRPASAAGADAKEHIETMRQAAQELQETNPDLSDKLNEFADKKEAWKEEHGADKMAQKKQDLDTVRRSAEHLKNDTDEEGQELGNQLDEVVSRWEEKLNKMEAKMKEKAVE